MASRVQIPVAAVVGLVFAVAIVAAALLGAGAVEALSTAWRAYQRGQVEKATQEQKTERTGLWADLGQALVGGFTSGVKGAVGAV